MTKAAKQHLAVETYRAQEEVGLRKGERLLTEEQVMERFGVSPRQMKAIRLGEGGEPLPHIRVTRTERRYRVTDVLAFEARRMRRATA